MKNEWIEGPDDKQESVFVFLTHPESACFSLRPQWVHNLWMKKRREERKDREEEGKTAGQETWASRYKSECRSGDVGFSLDVRRSTTSM